VDHKTAISLGWHAPVRKTTYPMSILVRYPVTSLEAQGSPQEIDDVSDVHNWKSRLQWFLLVGYTRPILMYSGLGRPCH
jgi:hypothetical protein